MNWRQPAGEPDHPVPLSDTSGKPLANDLVDGQEVEIVSWYPRAREGLLYQVRRLTDGSEWWIAAVYLRRSTAAQPLWPVADAPPPRGVVERPLRRSKR